MWLESCLLGWIRYKVVIMNNKISYILWDFNGTLLDDVSYCHNILNEMLRNEKVATVDTLEDYRRVFQFPVKTYYRNVGFNLDNSSFDELSKYFIAAYLKDIDKTRLYEDVILVLKIFEESAIRQSIISASDQKILIEQIERLKIGHYFEEICGIDNIYASSKAEIAKGFVNNLQINKNEIVLIGDSVHDYQVAQECEIRCILVARGHEHKGKLAKYECVLVDTLKETVKMVDNLN